MVGAAQDCRAGLWFPASVNSPGRTTDWSCIWWIQRRACVPNYINRFKTSYIRSKFKPKPLVGAKLTKRVYQEFLNMSFKCYCWNALLWHEIRPAIRIIRRNLKNVNILSSNLNLSQWDFFSPSLMPSSPSGKFVLMNLKRMKDEKSFSSHQNNKSVIEFYILFTVTTVHLPKSCCQTCLEHKSFDGVLKYIFKEHNADSKY